MKLRPTIGIFLAMAAILMSPAHRAWAYESPKAMVVETSTYKMSLDEATGALLSLEMFGKEFAAPSKAPRSLFSIRLRDEKGGPVTLDALKAQKTSMTRADEPDQTIITIHFEQIDGKPVSALVTARCLRDKPFVYWQISVENGTGMFIDFIDFPAVVVPNDLIGSGGTSRVFRPNVEGVLIEDLEHRGRGWCPPQSTEYPNSGWNFGIYPGVVSMQFMAYYDGQDRGLYLGAHDVNSLTKGIGLFERDGGLLLQFRLYPGAPVEKYTMPYEMVMGGFRGDWHDAADIYRDWREKTMTLGPKLRDNPRIPDWFKESPVVVIYPLRGQKDTGDMTPNEYFPFTNALPSIDKLAKNYNSKILTLLAQWEGTAPWAPPYVWPPMGGEKMFQDFTDAMHARKNLVGLYASGLGYTTHSMVIKSYNQKKEFAEKNLKSVMDVAPDGTLANNGACVAEQGQRLGYDMCPGPANTYVKDVTRDQFGKMLKSGVDYIQYFDQNLGGGCYYCYAKTHGHAPAPGPWMTEEMGKIHKYLNRMIEASGHKVLIGAEGAAAEPFTSDLLMNDLRFEVNYSEGKPVPAYAYIFHEYLNGFMGNQNGIQNIFDIDITRAPLHFHQRLAYSFVAGDMLTVVLAGGDTANWCWGITWEKPMPDQPSINKLIANLNAWRRGAARPYLIEGRMLKPLRLDGATDVPMFTYQDKQMHFDSLFTSRWQSPKKQIAQVVANYTLKPQTCRLLCPEQPRAKVLVYTAADGPGKEAQLDAKGSLSLDVPELSAVMVEFQK